MNAQRKHTLLLAVILLLLLGALFLFQHFPESVPSDTAPDTPSSVSQSHEPDTEGKTDNASAAGADLYAMIMRNGRLYTALALSENRELTLSNDFGDYNIIRVQDGAIYVEEANCGDLTCVHMGKMRQAGDMIACLPHGLIIYIENAASLAPEELEEILHTDGQDIRTGQELPER